MNVVVVLSPRVTRAGDHGDLLKLGKEKGVKIKEISGLSQALFDSCLRNRNVCIQKEQEQEIQKERNKEGKETRKDMDVACRPKSQAFGRFTIFVHAKEGEEVGPLKDLGILVVSVLTTCRTVPF